MVWMRVAALPDFRKLHRIVIHEGDFANGLPAGNYTVTIQYCRSLARYKYPSGILWLLHVINILISACQNNFILIILVAQTLFQCSSETLLLNAEMRRLSVIERRCIRIIGGRIFPATQELGTRC